MEFTLDQLTPENVTMLFGNAYYKAENNLFKNEEGIETAIGTIITSNNSRTIVYTDEQSQCITFRMSVSLEEEIRQDRKSLLEVCNIYDGFPVHAVIETEEDGEPYIAFVYKHIVPVGIDIAAKELVNVFRVFEKYCTQHRNMFYELHKSLA